MVDICTTGVVTVTYNSEGVIDGFLCSLLAQTCSDFVLYVVDNASTDRTLEKLKQYSDPRIIVIANEENVGIAKANNQGIRCALKAQCNSVLLINNDTEFDADLLSVLRNGMREYAIDMIVPKISYFDEPAKIWYAGGHFNRWKGHLAVHDYLGESDCGQFDVIRFVEYAPTCCMLFDSRVFEKIGLMDENYFIYVDDADFCLRASRSGMKLAYFPVATLKHKVSSLAGGTSEFSSRHFTRGHIYFIRKHLGLWKGVYYLCAFQVSLLFKLLRRVLDWNELLGREAALFEGWRMQGPNCSEIYEK